MKNKNISVTNDVQETKVIRHDFIFVVCLNLVLFAAMIGLYFWNRSTGQLDHFFSSIIKF
jgi:hypothetical protein